MLFGTGRDPRRVIKEHYAPVAKRQRRRVVVEVKVPVLRGERGRVDGADNVVDGDDFDNREGRQWRLEARWVEAQVFVWRGFVEGSERNWELGEAISGAYDEGGGLGIEIEEMGDGGERGEVGEEEAELGKLRLDGESEWARPGVFGEGNDIADAQAVEW